MIPALVTSFILFAPPNVDKRKDIIEHRKISVASCTKKYYEEIIKDIDDINTINSFFENLSRLQEINAGLIFDVELSRYINKGGMTRSEAVEVIRQWFKDNCNVTVEKLR